MRRGHRGIQRVWDIDAPIIVAKNPFPRLGSAPEWNEIARTELERLIHAELRLVRQRAALVQHKADIGHIV